MNTFDASKHPRNAVTGEFTDRTHLPADLELPAPSGRPVTLALGEQESFTELAEDPIRDINVHRYEDGTYTVHPAMDLNIADVLSAEELRTTEASAAAYRDRNWMLIQDFLQERYGAEVTSTDDEGIVRVEFTAELGDVALTEGEIIDAAWNGTKIIALANESDHGTFGTENLGRLITDRVAACVSVADRMKAYGAAQRLTDSQIDFEIKSKMGTAELRDETAMAIAHRLSEQFGRKDFPVLYKLSYAGYADAEALGQELRTLHTDNGFGRTGDRINMMFTWALHGGEPEAKAA